MKSIRGSNNFIKENILIRKNIPYSYQSLVIIILIQIKFPIIFEIIILLSLKYNIYIHCILLN